MNPHRSSLQLSEEQQQRYDESAHLVTYEVGRYGRFCRPEEHDELAQHARLSLVRVCQGYLHLSIERFLPYARMSVRNACRNYCFGRGRLATLRDADTFELSENTPVKKNDEDVLTLGQVAENDLARDEGNGDLCHAARLFEIRQAVAELKNLTQRERRLLKLRFIDGLEQQQVAVKLGISVVQSKRVLRSALAKLRAHFAHLGALAPDAAIPRDTSAANENHWRYR